MDRFRRSQLKRLVSDSKKKKSKTKLKDRNRNVALLTFDPVLDNNSIASDISSCQLSISPVQCFLNVAANGKLQDFQKLYNESPERIEITDDNGNTVLHLASANGHLCVVDFILQHGGDINAQNNSGDTPLHEAVRNVQTTIIDFLLKHEADSSILNEFHMAPIHLSIDIDSLKSLEALLKHPSVDVHIVGEAGATPLHYCAFKDRTECTKLLLEHGAKPCTKCDHGYYPIHTAARAASAKTMEVLIKYVEALGYTRRQVLSFEDKENNTPLHSAVNSGHPEGLGVMVFNTTLNNISVISLRSVLLVEKTGVTGETNPPTCCMYNLVCNTNQAVRVCLNCGAPVDSQQEDKSTPLHFACAQGGLEMIEIMYELQETNFISAMEKTDILKMTPLHRAALFNHVHVVEYLLDKGANINPQDVNNRTPLFVAASKRAWKSVNLLIKRGANMTLKDEKSRNFLHVIIKGGGSLNLFEDEVVKNIKNLLNETDEIGCTPLHYATRGGQLDALDNLMKMGALLNPKNHQKQSPLHFAARYGRYNTCKRLLNSKDGPGIINETDENGLTALHHAAKNGHVKIITLLMQKGAYVTKDNDDNSPLHMAVMHGYTRSMRSILNVHGNLLDASNKYGNTPLHTAAYVGQCTAVTLLMEADAKFSQNIDGKTFLDLAIDNKRVEVASAIVKHDRWMEVLHTCSKAGGPMSRLIEHMPVVCMIVLDNCQTPSDKVEKNKKSFYTDYDFQFLQCKFRKNIDGKDVLPMYALNLMVKFGRVELLSHPLCKAYLAMKWRAYGIWLYSVNFIFYIVFLGMLTYLVVLPSSFHMSAENNTNSNSSLMSSSGENKVDMGYEMSKWVVLIFTILNIIKEIFQMVQQRMKYLTDLNNALEWVLYISSALFVGPVLFGYGDHLEIEAGAVAIFLAWFNCLLFLQRFDFFGIYVVMFLEILRTLLQALSVFSLLIVAFGLSFYLLMRTETSQAYSSPGLSILRTGIMMLELDYMTSFNDPYSDNDERTLPYKTPTMILLVIFILIMPILLMNLLIGLAVGDIEAVQKDATLKRLAMQVELHTDFERRLPKTILDRVDKVNYRVYPNCKVSFLKSIWSKMTWHNTHDDSSNSHNENVEMAMELAKQKAKIKQLSTFVEKNHELLRLIVQKMEIKTEDDHLDEGDTMTREELQCKAKCQKKYNKWKSENLNKNIKQSMVISKWKQMSTDRSDNTDC